MSTVLTMNRKSANDYDDSDDSASDWDTTAAESPVRPNPPIPFSRVEEEDEPDGDYATVTPKHRGNLKESDPSHSAKTPPRTTPRKDIPKRKEEVFSPPPHLNSFKNALSDYSEVYEPAPDVPPKLFEDGRGQVYTIPDTARSAPQVTINWDDSDADEKVLRELRHNREKEKDRQRQEAANRSEPDSRDQQQQQLQQQQQASTKTSSAIDNQGFESSPKTPRSAKSVLEQWAKESHDTSTVNGGDSKAGGRHTTQTERHKKMKKRKPALLPVTVRDSHGKKCVFYFEDNSHHFLEAADDDVDAFLPDKLEEIEMIYKRVWREMFSAVRIVTSFFVLFVTEFLSLAIHHILRPLVLDSLTALGNYFFKPFMTIVFNMIVQPFFALVWNSFNAMFMAAGPFVQLLGAVCSQIAIVVQSFRLFHISYHSQHPHPQWKPPEVV